ncbi:Histone deacetylase [Saliniradius amylolyticus]|uniref:Histone deacetylase n=1 Tax=Saliniradius amylolyticus TaxID=2183582 RepID=A0A2S2E6Z8_9ALTE|nr:histone deacetylase [Saliniradius amylolyticus]AWL12747.1 Histone deacetylase [Saliniradius amylolyticus]
MVPLVFDPIYSQLDLPRRHRFPIEKYQGIYDALIAQGITESCFHRPQPLSEQRILAEFDPDYIGPLLEGALDAKAMRRIGFPWSSQLIRRTRTAVAGTLLTAELALAHGKALNLTGGYHHAHYDFGSGFCLVNDLYLAANAMLASPDIDKVLVFDCDVHQGDGTAALAQGRDDIITVSLHGEKNFPHRKQVSDMDFGLPKGTQDNEYLPVVENALDMALNLYRPDAVIYDAGVDIHIDDDLGHLDISTQGVYQRDRLVFNRCEQEGLPVAAVIGGGYQRDIPALVEVHLQLFRAAGVISNTTSRSAPAY